MEKLNRFYTLFVLLSLPLLSHGGGGWTLKKNTAYYKVSQWWIVASQHFTGTGQIDPNATNGIYNTSLYAEYGLSDRLTGILYLPFFSRNVRNAQVSSTNGMVIREGEAINGIGDSEIGFKYRISKDDSPFAFSATLQFGIPLGENSGGSDGSLQTGDGEFNQMLKLDLSRSFSLANVNAYASIYSGLNNRTNDFSDEFRYGAELGVAVVKNKLWGIGRLDVVESLQNGLSSADGSNGVTIFANNTEFAAFTFEAAFYATEKFGVSAAYGGAFSGKLIFADPSYSVGVFLDLK